MAKKLILACCLCVTLIIIMSVSAYADESIIIQETKSGSVYLDANAKMTFAERKRQEYSEMVAAKEEADMDHDYVLALLSRTVRVDEIEATLIKAELETYGIYEFPTEIIERNDVVPLIDGNDVYVANPSIYYDASTNRWVVVTGGQWLTENYDDNFIFLNPDVGGLDGYGVAFTSTSGYNSSVVDVLGTIYTENGDLSQIRNRSDGNGGLGFGFRQQDKYIQVGLAKYVYLGDQWSGICYYDSEFASFSAVATSYYVHTYDSASISSITFGVSGKQAGLEIAIENSAGSFVAYSDDVRKHAQ